MNHLLVNDTPRPIDKLLRTFQRFASLEAASGLVLMACALAALVWANSTWGQSYARLWQTPVTLGFTPLALSKPLLLWINDGLMALFFFLVGLEIKREMLIGELASFKRSALPVMAAIGGMLVPAGLYACFNLSKPGEPGWGIPMATDIAFSLGVLALLGTRAPFALKIFLTALAIADDIGAVLVIALFYTGQISGTALLAAAALLAALILVNRLGVQSILPYVVLGVGLWLAMLKSGVHATIAGILLAMCIPARPLGAWSPLAKLRTTLFRWRKRLPVPARQTGLPEGVPHMASQQNPSPTAHPLNTPPQNGDSLMIRLEHALHPWVSFGVMPLFALANAGVTIHGGLPEAINHPVSLGVLAGLVLGKPVGILSFSWLAVRLGIAALPNGAHWRHILGVGMLGGIGFTMSLFVAGLAFGQTALLDSAKVGILLASLMSGLAGGLFLLAASRQRPAEWSATEGGDLPRLAERDREGERRNRHPAETPSRQRS